MLWVQLAGVLLLSGCSRIGFEAPRDGDGSSRNAGDQRGDTLSTGGDNAPSGDDRTLGPITAAPCPTDLWSASSELIGFWPFNDNATVATDRSVYGNNGALSGAGGAQGAPVYIPGVAADALRFDGMDDRVSIPDNNDIFDMGNSEYSVEAWVRTTDCGNFPTFVGRDDATQLLSLGCLPGGAAAVVISSSDDPVVSVVASTEPIDTGEWHHLAFVRRTTTLDLYVDGRLAGTGLPVPGSFISAAPLTIGGSTAGNYAAADIDEVRIWSCAFDPQQVARLAATVRPGLIAYWPLEGNAEEWIGSGYDGTVVGNGVTFGTGQTGLGAIFDGTGSRIEWSLPEWFAHTHTVTVWFRSTSTGAQQSIINREAPPRGPVHLWINDTGMQTNVRDINFDGLGGFVTDNFVDDVWHCVAIVRIGLDNGPMTARMFIDGVLRVEDSQTLTDTSVTSNPLTIGYRTSGDPRPFLGVIDEVMVYDRALGAGEIVAAYSASLGCQPWESRRCSSGEIYWFDDCGKRSALAQNCPYGCARDTCELAGPGCLMPPCGWLAGTQPIGSWTSSQVSPDTRRTRDIALADFNDDGVLDLVTGNVADQVNMIYLGNGAGAFGIGSAISSDADTTAAVAVGDFNNDGQPDFVAGNQTSASRLYLGTGAGTFGPGTDIGTVAQATHALGAADLNGDGSLDLILGNWMEADRIYLGDGTGTLTLASTLSVNDESSCIDCLAIGDIDGDDIFDLVLGQNSGSVQIQALIGGGDGTFTPGQVVATGGGVITVKLGDMNNDKVLDIVATVVSSTGPISIYLGIGDGTFSAPSTVASSGDKRKLRLTDANADGDLEVVVVGDGSNHRTHFGNGDGTLQAAVIVSDTNESYGVEMADLDFDGIIDMVVGNGRFTDQLNRVYIGEP